MLYKKILSLLRRIEYTTPGDKQVSYDTFVSQQHLAKFLAVYLKRVDDFGSGLNPLYFLKKYIY
jgi:hypothetical protein